ncbi:endonuclease III [Deltaproteobacteria bacterium PRO3]|nr:endonuclease III [Deltaproteobacteria bacterium PRO3]
MPVPKATKILEKLRKLYPEARCGLDYGSPFELLIATILSAQCTDKRVNLVTPALFQRANRPEKILKLGEKGLVSFIKTCGLYQAKAKNILATCEKLVREFEGKVPASLEALTQLPGVGRKTANVVLSNAFDTPAIAVDTHVFRVSRRLGLARGKNPHQVELELQKVIPQKDWSEAHHLLIAHGRGLCSARSPQCEACPLNSECHYFLSERQGGASPSGRAGKTPPGERLSKGRRP